MFSLVYYGYLTLFECILRIKTSKIRKWGRFQSFLERGKFYAEWNNYSYAPRNGVFAPRKVTHQKVYLSVNKV